VIIVQSITQLTNEYLFSNCSQLSDILSHHMKTSMESSSLHNKSFHQTICSSYIYSHPINYSSSYYKYSLSLLTRMQSSNSLQSPFYSSTFLSMISSEMKLSFGFIHSCNAISVAIYEKRVSSHFRTDI
jgi:hypothetical protein